MLFAHLFVGTIFLALAGVSFALDRSLDGFIILIIGFGVLVRARRRWPADHDYYLGRNYTRRP